jgi:hypothetical protein
VQPAKALLLMLVTGHPLMEAGILAVVRLQLVTPVMVAFPLVTVYLKLP